MLFWLTIASLLRSLRKKDGIFYAPKGTKAKVKKNIDLIVIRRKSDGNLGNARPCHNCLDMMKAVGIKRIYYSTDDGIIKETVNHMVSIHSSSVTKQIERLYKDAPADDYSYYKDLLIKKVPDIIRFKNFKKFIKNDFYNVLPSCTFTETKNKYSTIVIFYDHEGNKIKEIFVY